MAEITADTMTPLYRAFMILPPSRVETKKVPTMDEMMEIAPSTKGNKLARTPKFTMTNPPRSMVATRVTA
jgi:hypothetical protein